MLQGLKFQVRGNSTQPHPKGARTGPSALKGSETGPLKPTNQGLQFGKGRSADVSACVCNDTRTQPFRPSVTEKHSPRSRGVAKQSTGRWRGGASLGVCMDSRRHREKV